MSNYNYKKDFNNITKNNKKLILYNNNNKQNYMASDIKKIIKANNIIVEDINQILHNEGIIFDNRLIIIKQLINKKYNKKNININLHNNIVYKILNLLNILAIDKRELYQKIFMFYCNKKSKINLNQYYTPITIGQFICNIMKPNKKLIDPACGTGDLIINYEGDITLWDISPDVINICEENYKINDKKYNISCKNSLAKYNENNNNYDYCCLNPPFGSSTVIKDKKILDNYVLGKNKKKEEIGILFIERGINLLKNNGIIFIIVPNGYLGNSSKNIKQLREYLLSYRIISILELPENTFSRSGTGVSTSLIIVQKKKTNKPYNILIKKINNIGYILNKKNTPYKYKVKDGKYIIKNKKPILDNDFIECGNEFNIFIKKEKIKNMLMKKEKDNNNKYQYINTLKLDNNILDINRYLHKYTSIIKKSKENNNNKILNYLKKNVNSKFSIINDKKYIYLDIRQITTPTYNKYNYIYGYNLPSRAKIKLEKYDIIVSKLKGKTSFSIILDSFDNIICSNGFVLLRPKDFNSAIIIFANLFSNKFKIQHNSLCTGSIMASISENDIQNIYIDNNINITKYKKVLDALIIINNEL